MSVAALEAMAAGLPLILTPAPGSELLVEDGVNGYLFPFGDSKRLAFLLEELADNTSLRDVLSSASRKRAEAFDWESVADTYVEVLHSLAVP